MVCAATAQGLPCASFCKRSLPLQVGNGLCTHALNGHLPSALLPKARHALLYFAALTPALVQHSYRIAAIH